MNLRISMKSIMWMWIFLILLLLGLGYNAYDRLRPDTFIQIASEQIQKNFPNTKVVVGEIDYSISLDFNVKLRSVEIKREDVNIAKIDELELKLPWWLLITHKGNAHIYLNQLEVFLSNTDVKTLAKASNDGEETRSIEIEMPTYLSNAEYTLRAKDIFLKSEDASQTYLHISKLLVREFALGKNSAFEIKLPVWLKHNGLSYSSEVWLFGDLTPTNKKWDFNYTGDFRTKDLDAKINFDDVALEGKMVLNMPVFTMSSQTNFMIDKEEKGNLKFSQNQKGWTVDLDLISMPLEFMALFEKEILNEYFKKFEGDAQGQISIHQSFDSDLILLEGNIEYGGKFRSPQKTIEGKWNLNFDNNQWIHRFEGENLKYVRENLISYGVGTILEIKETISAKGYNWSDVTSLLPSLENIARTDIPHQRSIELIDILRSEEIVLTNAEIITNAAAVNYSLKYSSQNSKLEFIYLDDAEMNVDFKAQNFLIDEHFHQLKPYLSGKGVINAELSARNAELFPKGQWNFKSELEIGQLEGIIPSYLNQLWDQLGSRPVKQKYDFYRDNKLSRLNFSSLDGKALHYKLDLNPEFDQDSSASVTFAGRKLKKEVKKISLDFLKKDIP